MEKCCPDHDNKAVDDASWGCKDMVPFFILLVQGDDHVDGEADADNGHWDEPACVVHKPGEIEAEFFTVILLEEVDRLHVPQEIVSSHHAPRETPAVLEP